MYSFIINPNSRSGLGLHIWEEIQPLLEQKHIDYEFFLTQYQKHATRIARELTSDGKQHTVVVLGGDGTVNEVINGICCFENVTLGYIPAGSGNDFARGYRLPAEPAAALQNILSAKQIRTADIGVLSYKNKKKLFAVSSGIGFDAAICHEAVVSGLKFFLNRLHLGKLTYVLIALHQWLFLTPGKVTLKLDNGECHTFSRCYFAASMNQRYEGGGFMFAPDADPDDGKLDVCIIADLSRLKMLLLLPTAVFGKHTRFRGVFTCRCQKLTIHAERALPVHTDGEPLFLQKDVTLECLPQKLRIIT